MGYYRTKPQEGQSLASYIMQFADDNCLNPLVVLNHMSWRNSRITKIDTHKLLLCKLKMDFFYEVFKTESRDFVDNMILKTSFNSLAEKMVSARNRTIINPGYLKGIFEKKLKYCPICLKENNYYQLLWQVKEIRHCNKHDTVLLDKCPNCSCSIPLVPKWGVNGICPECGFMLKKARPQKKYEYSYMDRVYDDWESLMNFERINPLIPELNIEQSLIVALIYLKTQRISSLKQLKYIPEDIKNLRNCFKTAESTNYTINLQTVMDTIRTSNLKIIDLRDLKISSSFIDSISLNYLSEHFAK